MAPIILRPLVCLLIFLATSMGFTPVWTNWNIIKASYIHMYHIILRVVSCENGSNSFATPRSSPHPLPLPCNELWIPRPWAKILVLEGKAVATEADVFPNFCQDMRRVSNYDAAGSWIGGKQQGGLWWNLEGLWRGDMSWFEWNKKSRLLILNGENQAVLHGIALFKSTLSTKRTARQQTLCKGARLSDSAGVQNGTYIIRTHKVLQYRSVGFLYLIGH